MIVIFDKRTNQVIGVASKVYDSGSWREPEIHELYPDADLNQLDCVYMEDSPKFCMRPDAWQLKLNERGMPIGVERKPALPKIYLTTTAQDTDGDGLPELAADAISKASITAEVKDANGNLVNKDFMLTFRTTGGSLSGRRVEAKHGTATVELTSTVETITVTVSVSAEGIQSGSLTFELMPPEG
jgi:Big-like domain-containing protein